MIWGVKLGYANVLSTKVIVLRDQVGKCRIKNNEGKSWKKVKTHTKTTIMKRLNNKGDN